MAATPRCLDFRDPNELLQDKISWDVLLLPLGWTPGPEDERYVSTWVKPGGRPGVVSGNVKNLHGREVFWSWSRYAGGLPIKRHLTKADVWWYTRTGQLLDTPEARTHCCDVVDAYILGR